MVDKTPCEEKNEAWMDEKRKYYEKSLLLLNSISRQLAEILAIENRPRIKVGEFSGNTSDNWTQVFYLNTQDYTENIRLVVQNDNQSFGIKFRVTTSLAHSEYAYPETLVNPYSKSEIDIVPPVSDLKVEVISDTAGQSCNYRVNYIVVRPR